MQEKVLILDFGSQYTQLIARRVRELEIYCEIIPYNKDFTIEDGLKAVILSGSPYSVNDEKALKLDLQKFIHKIPVLGICYGAQLVASQMGGRVASSNKREYGKAKLEIVEEDVFLNGFKEDAQIWMSHADSILEIPSNFKLLAKTESIPIAAYKSEGFDHPSYCIQFHPEVYHTTKGIELFRHFLVDLAGCNCNWTPRSFVQQSIDELKAKIGTDKVVMGLSGGVDSTVAAMLLHEAIGSQLHCIFVDNGLLRYQEFEEVLESYNGMGLNVSGVDAKQLFYDALKGETDPEKKRKIIGKAFIDVFEAEANKIPGVAWLGQGTIYPDVIESVSVHGPSATIKSHHNVGGLPDRLNLKIVEPLRNLFKDEVRKAGKEMQIKHAILGRHPFPGPGLAIRILGDITASKVELLQKADHIYINYLKKHNLYDEVWQAGAILLPVKSVGVMGDERTYENTVALRAVSSTDGMTADWSRLPMDVLAEISNEIINTVKGVNRVVYDISTKPPATIEWE